MAKLSENFVIAVYDPNLGSEFGPRSLGARSILANPTKMVGTPRKNLGMNIKLIDSQVCLVLDSQIVRQMLKVYVQIQIWLKELVSAELV